MEICSVSLHIPGPEPVLFYDELMWVDDRTNVLEFVDKDGGVHTFSGTWHVVKRDVVEPEKK